MIALTIRQPWAWLIVNGFKDVENRSWPTGIRGRFLVHAGKGMTRKEYETARLFARGLDVIVPAPEFLERGGFIGSVKIDDCVKLSGSRWFFGPYGYTLRDPRPLPFIPWPGQLGFFVLPRTIEDLEKETTQ